jgi:hypothetical protein
MSSKQTYYVVMYCPQGDASKSWPCEAAIFTNKLKAEADLECWRYIGGPCENYQLVEITLFEEEARAIALSGGEPIP